MTSDNAADATALCENLSTTDVEHSLVSLLIVKGNRDDDDDDDDVPASRHDVIVDLTSAFPPGNDDGAIPSSHFACRLPGNASVTSMASSTRSDTNSSTVGPTCRICDYPGDSANQLISPCRCAGTSKFVHEQCLNKWLETIKSHSSPHCEVCRYQIRTHKGYRTNNWRLPDMTRRDKILHVVFLVSVIVLVVCAVANVVGIIADGRTNGASAGAAPATHQSSRVAMTTVEGVTLVSGLLFFVAFVVALVTQIKARDNIYHVVVRCVATNAVWRIDDYRRSRDSLFVK